MLDIYTEFTKIQNKRNKAWADFERNKDTATTEEIEELKASLCNAFQNLDRKVDRLTRQSILERFPDLPEVVADRCLVQGRKESGGSGDYGVYTAAAQAAAFANDIVRLIKEDN